MLFSFIGRIREKISFFLLKKAKINELYYINGSDSLPPPLSPDEEDELISRIDTHEARCILVEHNLRLVAYIAKRFENTGANIEELISIGTVGLVKAISTFNVDNCWNSQSVFV